MKIIKRYAKVLAAAVLAVSSFGGTAEAGLKDAGPVDPMHGFATWYRDNATAPYPNGIPLELCLVPGPCVLPVQGQEPTYNPTLPLSFSTGLPGPEEPVGAFNGNFPSESFYYYATTDTTLGAGKFVYIAAAEAAFLSPPPGLPAAGMQTAFIRTRIVLDKVADGTYTIRHPYGTTTLTTTGGKATYTNDVPLRFSPPLNNTASTMNTFLLPSTVPGGLPLPAANVNIDPLNPAATAKFIADPNRIGPITNGPFRNFIQITGGPVAAPVDITLNNFTLVGKINVFPAVPTVTPPATTDFGIVGIGFTSAPLTFTIANTAELPGAPLTVDSLVFSDPQFKVQASLAANACATPPFTLEAGTSCTFDVVLQPTLPNLLSSTLTVNTTPAPATPAVFNLAGTGVVEPPTVSVTSDKTTQVVGLPVNLTAIGGGPLGAYDYRFLLSSDGGATYTTKQDGAAATWQWNTATAAPGLYKIQVEIRPQGQPAVAAAATATVDVTLINITLSVAASPATTTNTGLPVTFTATTPPVAGLEYEYQLFANGVWQIVKPFSAVPTWTWTTTGLPAGAYRISVALRGTPVPVAPVTINYTLGGPVAAVRAVNLTPSPKPSAVGRPVTFTATATGGSGNIQYRYLVNTRGVWAEVQPWGPTSTYTYPASAAGKYSVRVEARSFGSQVVVTKTSSFTLK